MPFPTSSNCKAEGDNDGFSKDIGLGENRCRFTELEMLLPDVSSVVNSLSSPADDPSV